MAKLTTIARTQERRVCIFGPPKSGKTKLAGSLAEHYKILFFSLENGHLTLTTLPLEWQENIEIIIIRDSKEYPIAAETMLKVIKGGPVDICVAHSKVSCPLCKKSGAPQEHVHLNALGPEWIVVIDSLTQMTQSLIAHITKAQDELYKLQLDDWGALKVLTEKFLSQVQVAPYNVICITHEEEVKFEDGRAKIVPVAGSANSSRNTAKYFDDIVYCNLANKKHVVGSATDYSMSVLTGSRTNIKLESSKEPTLLDMFTTWKDKIGWNKEEQNVGSSNDSGNNLDNSGNTSSSGVNQLSVVDVSESPVKVVASTGSDAASALARLTKLKGLQK